MELETVNIQDIIKQCRFQLVYVHVKCGLWEEW
jgi:hypothetical protein